MKDPLVYMIADTFHVNLHKMAPGDIRGLNEGHTIKLAGMWEVPVPLTVVVDENTSQLCTAFARIYGNLWAYAMATEKGVTIMFFDSTRVKIRVGAEKEFGLGSAIATMGKLKPHLTRAFFCKHEHGVPAAWEPVDLTKA